MDKQILHFTANEQALTVDEPIKISTNKVNYIQANFDLGQNWQGYDSIRAIWFNDFQTISTVLDSLGNCAVPFEVMKRKGNVKVNLVGSISEDDVLTDRLTSYPVVAVIVDCTAQITGANTSPITPSEYEQFVAAVHEDAERAEAGATASEQSAQNAHTSEQNASQSAQSAHDNKIAIEQAIAEVIQQIEDFEQVQVVANTLPPSSQATSDFTDGVLTLGIPQGVKGDTGNGIQSITKTGTSGLVDTYTITFTNGQTTTFTVTNGAKGDTGNGIASIEKTSTVGLVDTYTITYTDGTTSTFTVTNGEKGEKGDTGEVSLSELEDATIVQTLSDSTPYNYRRTNNGNGSGHREYDEIVGASVGWNQLMRASDSDRSSTSYGVALTDNRDGTYTLNGTVSRSGNDNIGRTVPLINGHIYAVIVDSNIRLTDTQSYSTTKGSRLLKATSTASRTFSIYYASGDVDTTFNNLLVFPMVVDITLSLGSTIADYVYGLGSSSGVTWLKTHFPKLFDNGYQPYDAGSIKSVSGLTAHEMVGKNLISPTIYELAYANGEILGGNTSYRSLYAHVVSGQTYTISRNAVSGNRFRIYGTAEEPADGVEATPLAQDDTALQLQVSVPQGINYVFVYLANDGSTITSNIQLEVGSTATPYEPYESHTYPLDSSVTLRGQYKLDANNNLYADGDVYPSSGQIGRTWDELDLGSLNWYKDGEREIQRYYTNDLSALMARPQTSSTLADIVVPYYTLISQSASWNQDKTVSVTTGGTLYFMTSAYSTPADFKASVNGVHMVYKKATPTTETATPYTSPQWCDSHGTEEYVGSELPVGHNTTYPMTLIDTADGLSNGTYEPRITVANGKKTVTWVSV